MTAIIFLIAALAFAQPGASVAGVVVDAQGAAVPGAVVRLYARGRAAQLTTTTDAAGAYRFARLAPGDYLLDAEAPGFARAPAGEARVAAGAETKLDLTLQPAGVRSEIVITAAGTPQAVDEVSKAVTVVEQAEIDARDEFYLAEALRTVPGLRVRQLGGPGAQTTIRTRGLRNQDTAVLLDGMRIRDAAAPQGDAVSLIGSLAVTDISRVEVVRGSGSSLYGTNAIGGVVNLVTDEGGGTPRGSVLLEGGSLSLFRGRAQVAGGAAGERIAYSAGLSHFNITRGVDGDDASRNTSFQGRVLFRLAPRATLAARLYAADAFLQLNEGPDIIGALPATGVVAAVPLASAELRRYEAGTPREDLNVGDATFIPSINDPDGSQAARFFAGALTLNGSLGRGASYTVAYQGFTSGRTTRDGPGGVSPFEPFGGNTRANNDGRIDTLEARVDLQLGRANLLTAGYEFEREGFDARSVPTDPRGATSVEVSERSHAVFVQDQWRLFDDRLQFAASFRAQFFALRPPSFTPAAGAPYAGSFSAPPDAYTGDGSVAYLVRSTGTKLRAHAGNGYRAPSLYERFGTFFSGFSNSFVALSDPRLRPDRSFAFDVGLDQSLADNRVRASATYFYTRLQEVVGFGQPAQPDPYGRFFSGYLNTRGGLARGLELSLASTPWRSLGLNAAYTYTNSDERTPVDGVVRALAIPDHQFSLVATQRLGARVLVNFDLLAASSYLAPLFRTVPPYDQRVYRFAGPVKADLGASYTLPLSEAKSLRFFGKVDNLFGREYFEDGFRTPGRVGVGGLAFNF